MPDKPQITFDSGLKCGTSATGWQMGGQFGKNSMRTKKNVKVTHCGVFFVYQLPSAPECRLRYGAENS